MHHALGHSACAMCPIITGVVAILVGEYYDFSNEPFADMSLER